MRCNEHDQSATAILFQRRFYNKKYLQWKCISSK